MRASDQVLLTLITIFTTAVQAQFTRCFTDPGCATLVGGPSSNAENCCVNNNAGLYYSDGGQCFQCIVYGWGSDNFTRPEAQFPYDVPFAYFKGPSNAQLRMAIDYNGEGTASEDEFGIGQSVVSLPLNPGGTTSITFQKDRVALEPDETFVLELALLGVANFNRALFNSSLPNVFFRSRQEFIIQDSTALVFRLRESDRVVDEGRRSTPVEVTVANEVELASDISLVLTPMIATENFRPLPTTTPLARANTFEGRIDFFTSPITLNFVAGGEILLAGDVLIFDDLINEALEYFVVTLTFQDPNNVPPLASIESDGGNIIRIDIIDDDDIFIGFALPSTTYPEIECDYRVQIIKGAGNVTEQTISFVVNLFQTAPERLGTATPSANTEDNDFSFPSTVLLSILPEENDTFVTDLIIFGDNLPEVTEAAQLRLSLPTDGMFPGFETLPQYPEFFIIIEDDDPFRIGFENTSYIVNEGIGTLEVCVKMFEPPEESSIGELMVGLGVETVRGTADGSDYTEVTGARDSFFVSFNNRNRRSCFFVEIKEDERYEFEEQFSLRFIELEGSTLPSTLVLDPARSNITIVDNEEVTVGFINPPYSAREDEGPMIFTVRVTSNHILDRDIELSFSTVDGLIADFAAMAGVDYTSVINMPIILSAGMQSIDISVKLNPDQIFESNEIFQGTLTIISGERVSLSPGTADATIIENEAIQCPPLPMYPNGMITYSSGPSPNFPIGTTAVYECNAPEGYCLPADATLRECEPSGTWSGVEPEPCGRISCAFLGIMNGVVGYSDGPPIQDGTTVNQTCLPGFELRGSSIRTCNAVSQTPVNCEEFMGNWTGQAVMCAIQCNPLDEIENGFITYAPDVTPNYDLGTVAFYACDAGFVLDISLGSTFRMCVDDDGLDAIGVFDNQAPRCVPIECPVLPVFPNGMIVYATDVIPNFDVGTTATYSCNEGYTLDLSIGVEVRTCIDDGDNDVVGMFSDQEPACVLVAGIQCTPLSGIPMGRIEYGPDMTPNYMLGTTATYICNDGFFLDLSVGNEVRTCEDDNGLDDLGEFTGSKPTCVPGCKAEIYQSHSWPNTALGSTALSPCPCVEVLGVLAGNVSRQCSGSISEGGMWKDELDLSSCETTLSDISRELCEITLGLSSNKTTQSSNQIANITSKPQNLAASQITLVTAIVEQVAEEAAVNQEVRDNYLQTINNIQQADADVIYESQLAMKSSTRILASLETFLDNLNISTLSRNSTSNQTVLSFETFAITVQDLDPDSFQGQTFVVGLGPVEAAVNNTGVIDKDALMTANDYMTDNRSEIDSLSEDTENSTASLRLSPLILEECPTRNRSLRQRLSYSVFLSDVLFLPDNRSTSQVGSIVVAARLACLQTNKTVLTVPVQTSFRIRMTDNIENSSCAVYKTRDQFGAWDTAGCREITSSNGRKDCECRQLGHFGILFDLNPTALPENLSIALSTITYIGLGLSVVCLVVFIFTIFVSKKLLADKQNQILINMSISLICLYFTFLIGGFTVGVPPLCGVMSALLQYFFLVFFSWTAVEAVWLYLKLVVVMGSQSLTSKFMLKAGLPAWLLPFMIVVISAGAGHQYYTNPYYCRPTEWPFYFGFILPFVIIYVFNWIVFIAIMVSICKHFRNLQSLNESSVRQRLKNVRKNLVIAMCLSVVLGLGWGLGLVSTSSDLVELSFTFQVIFSIFVGSQGVLIFILYGLRSTDFRQTWIKLFSGCRSNTDNFVFSEKGSTNPRDNSITVGVELSSMNTLPSKQCSARNEEKN